MYNDLSEALSELELSQIKVDFGKSSITLTNICNDGMDAVLDLLINEYEIEADQLEECVPAVKNLTKVELLQAALSGDNEELKLLLREARVLPYIKKSFDVGSKFSQTREITSVNGTLVTYKDQLGRTKAVVMSSFKAWASDKTAY